jgi:diaminobutyrate-2-oxoglutarate transaminase
MNNVPPLEAARGTVEDFEQLESGVRSYSRLFNRVFSKGRGPYLFDEDGQRFLDFLCGAGVLNYGHNNPHIKRALLAYIESGGIVSSLDLHTTAKRKFLHTFREVILEPRGFSYLVQFCGPTGTDAVEAALKLARKRTGRSGVVAFSNAYHGVSLGALAMTAGPLERGAAGVPLEYVIRMPFEGYLGAGIDTITVLEGMLAPGGGIERPAAIIVETVQAEGGINVASSQWLRRLQDLADRHAIVLIVDDIQVGCGRTGRFFSFERAGITPGIVCLSKAIGGIGLPFAIALIRPDLDCWSPGEHVGTFRGSNLAFAAGAAALDYWRTGEFEQAIEARALQMRSALDRIVGRHPADLIGVRGIGMIQGLHCREPSLARRILDCAFAGGMIVETSGAQRDVLKLLPPLVIEEAELNEGMSILAAAVDEAIRGTDRPSGRLAMGISATSETAEAKR